jgi:biopolymer transport protein ExbD
MTNKHRERNRGYAAKLEMTPMIDVVFQLLIFFIVTLKQEDILSYLNVSRPAPSVGICTDPQKLLNIEVGRTSWTVNGRSFAGERGLKALDKSLTKIAKISKNTTVAIKCTSDSPHAKLVQVLNICTREGMKNISVFSM